MGSKSSLQICVNWQKGQCNSGENCRFLHPAPSPTVLTFEDLKLKFKGAPKHAGKGIFHIQTIEQALLDDSSVPVVSIANYNFLASYNWLDSTKPTILVPGCPPRWRSPTLPVQVQKDSGRHFIDQNAHRCPHSPYAPFFECLLALHPNFDMTPISLITDRNSLRKLLNFASNKVSDPFQIDVETVGGTMILIRREKRNLDRIGKNENRGYGHEFENVFSTFDKDLAGSTSHHRIAQLDLGGIRCLLRFEADAYIHDIPGASEDKFDEDNSGKNDCLSAALKSLALSNNGDKESQSSTGVRVIERGRHVPPSSIVEAKSKKYGKKVTMKDVTPQLWFSQTENLIAGYHTDGKFDKVEHVAMGPIFEEWEAKNQSHLKKLVSLINWIKEATKNTKEGKCVVLCESKSKPLQLKIIRFEDHKLVVSKEIRDVFWNQNAGKE